MLSTPTNHSYANPSPIYGDMQPGRKLHVAIFREVEKHELAYFAGLAVTHVHGVSGGKFAVHVMRLNHGQVQKTWNKADDGKRKGLMPNIKTFGYTVASSRMEVALPLCYEIEAKFTINKNEDAGYRMTQFHLNYTTWDAIRIHVKTMYDFAWRKYAMAHTIEMTYYNQVATSHGIMNFLSLRDMKFW